MAFGYYSSQGPSIVRLCLNTARSALRWPHSAPFDLKRAPVFAIGNRVSLRKLRYSDLPEFYKLLQDPRTTNFFFMTPDGSAASAPPWFFMYNQLVSQYFEERLVYSVIINKTSAIGGMIEIRKSDDGKKWILGGFAAPEHRGYDFSSETVRLITKIFFETTSHEELYAHTAPANTRAQAFIRKCGFEYIHPSPEGFFVFVLRRSAFKERSVLNLT